MNFLEYLGFKKIMKDTDPTNVVKLPVNSIKPPVTPKPKTTEHYRVGLTTDGMTTLTLMGDYGNNMTLTMNKEYCEQLIRMLRSTYMEEHNAESK